MLGRIAFLSLLPMAVLVACDAVTDPRAGELDPRAVLGEWYTASLSGAPELYRTRIQGGGAPLFGEFRFPLHGRTWFVPFRDARWSGRTLTFATKTDFGFTLADTTVHWSATLAPERGQRGSADWEPARLTLAAHIADDVPFTWDYFRLRDLIELVPELQDAPVH